MREGTGDYLQPAAASRRAYILPISPMPMMPTVKPSMPSGTCEVCDEAAIFADQPAAESGTELARNGSHSSSSDTLVKKLVATRREGGVSCRCVLLSKVAQGKA